MKAGSIEEWAARRPAYGPRRSIGADDKLVLTAWGSGGDFEYCVTMKHDLEQFHVKAWRTVLARRLLTLRVELRKSIREDD
jgi:hypothetical protein